MRRHCADGRRAWESGAAVAPTGAELGSRAQALGAGPGGPDADFTRLGAELVKQVPTLPRSHTLRGNAAPSLF
jgi:hypothetical protein